MPADSDSNDSSGSATTRAGIKKDLLKADYERSQALYDTFVKRVQELNSVSDFSGYSTQAIAAPETGTPLVPSQRRRLEATVAMVNSLATL